MPDLLTFGETMVLLTPPGEGPMEDAYEFVRTMGGAETNFAIGAARLGASVGWFSRLGKDPFGSYILKKVRGEGVDTSRVRFDASYPTAVMFKELRMGEDPSVFYYRRGSACSQMSPDDLDEAYIAGAKILHVSGITPALSESCLQTVYKAIELAKKHGTKVSFDPNIRLKLWSIERAREVLLDLAKRCDIFLPGEEELRLLFEVETRDEWLEKLHTLDIPLIVVKLGAEGCLVLENGQSTAVPGYSVAKVIDTVGAGDGFAAGFLTSLLQGKTATEAAQYANAVGACCITVKGDMEGLPTTEKLEQFMGRSKQFVTR